MMNSSRASPTPAFGIRENGRPIRGSDVHHDLDADLGHVPLLGLLDGEVEQASVHIAGVTLSTRDGHRLPVLQLAGRRT
jgi:hypothetical protein